MIIKVVINLDEMQLTQFGKTPEDVAEAARDTIAGMLSGGAFVNNRGSGYLDFETDWEIPDDTDSLKATIKEALEDDDHRFKAYGGAAIRMSQSVRVRLEAAIKKG